MTALVKAFYEKRTSSVQYIVADPATKACAIIDPVLDFDEKSGSTATDSADAILREIERLDYEIEWILDTHPHADHISAAGYLKDRTCAPTGIGEKVTEVQAMWKDIYDLPDSFPTDGRQWDKLFVDGETFRIGGLPVRVLLSPGHTLASITYVVADDAAFIHDTLFMPDGGTARADFPAGDARDLWRSIQRILGVPDATRLFTGHDYAPKGREPAWESTVAQQKTQNIHLQKARSEDEFVRMREKRDKELPLPNQMLHALQVNIAGGRLPDETKTGKRFLKIPLNALPNAAL
jgi:glyoxylase-like metal-dependent hydrolase (beta-lactamase superfamily II)